MQPELITLDIGNVKQVYKHMQAHVFNSKKEAEDFASYGYPIIGINVGGGRQMPPEQFAAMRGASIIEDPVTGLFFVLASDSLISPNKPPIQTVNDPRPKPVDVLGTKSK